MYEANEAACDIVKDYIELIEYRQERWGESPSVERASYMKWAAAEILRALRKRKFDPPISVIESFGRKALDYARYNRQANKMFVIAADVADCIIDELVSQ